MTKIDYEESRKKIDIGIPRNLSLGILGIPSMFTRKELFRKNKFFKIITTGGGRGGWLTWLLINCIFARQEALINQFYNIFY